MVQKIQITLVFILIPLGILFWFMKSEGLTLEEIFYPGTHVVSVGDIPVRVELAETDEERTKGLSGRKDIGNMNGLLFVFPSEGYHGIWMKDMKFSIDVIWISEDLEVVGIEEIVTPETYPKTFRPPVPVKYIIETEARYTEIFGIHAGDKVELPPILEK